MSDMRISTTASILLVGAVLAWAAKAVAIGMAGGLDKSPLEGPLFIAGLVLFMLGVATVGLAVTAGRSILTRIAAAIAAVVIGFAVSMALNSAAGALEPADAHWVWSEVSLWIVSVVTALGWFAWRSRAASRTTAS